MNRIYVLFLGEKDWSEKHTVPKHVEFVFCGRLWDLPQKEQQRLADIVVLDRSIFPEEAD